MGKRDTMEAIIHQEAQYLVESLRDRAGKKIDAKVQCTVHLFSKIFSGKQCLHLEFQGFCQGATNNVILAPGDWPPHPSGRPRTQGPDGQDHSGLQALRPQQRLRRPPDEQPTADQGAVGAGAAELHRWRQETDGQALGDCLGFGGGLRGELRREGAA